MDLLNFIELNRKQTRIFCSTSLFQSFISYRYFPISLFLSAFLVWRSPFSRDFRLIVLYFRSLLYWFQIFCGGIQPGHRVVCLVQQCKILVVENSRVTFKFYKHVHLHSFFLRTKAWLVMARSDSHIARSFQRLRINFRRPPDQLPKPEIPSGSTPHAPSRIGTKLATYPDRT